MKAAVPTLSPRLSTWFRLLLLVALAAVAFGCKPKIGEDCATSTDCSLGGDRLCDVTQPGGYCTVFNCEPGQCPDGAACVAFSEGTCSATSVSTRFRRTFCMATCEDDSDCRGGEYRCLDTTNNPARQVVDINPSNRRICAVPSLNETPPTPPNPAVCYGSDASFDISRPEAGPGAPDANAPETPVPDGPLDRADTTSADRRDVADVTDATDATDATRDSSSAETGGETGADASDDLDPTDTGDAAEEPPPDANGPDATDDAAG